MIPKTTKTNEPAGNEYGPVKILIGSESPYDTCTLCVVIPMNERQIETHRNICLIMEYEQTDLRKVISDGALV